MTVEQLLKALEGLPLSARVTMMSDEEGNEEYTLDTVSMETNGCIILWPGERLSEE